jgi:F-type H+-transporting ATPase subunit delta
MAEVKISKRYAKGLFDFANSQNELEKINTEITLISDVLKENRELSVFLASPVWDEKKKMSVLKQVFSQISVSTSNFLSLVAKNSRAYLIGSIAYQFRILDNQHIDKSIAYLKLAEDLDENLVNQIMIAGKRQLSFNGKELEVVKKIDKSLIGGFVLQIKDKELDASIKNRLIDLKTKFDTKIYDSKI